MNKIGPLLEISGLTFSYPGRSVLFNNLDFSLSSGERVGLIGANGCGKSTLLYLMMGLLPYQEGNISLFNTLVSKEADLRELRKKTGFLFQNADDQLFSPTVVEDVAFGLLNLGFSPYEAKERSLAVLSSLGLEDLADQVTFKLSGGEKKLVSLATILVMEPELLLLDEPTTGLDPETVIHITTVLNEFTGTVLVVSHRHDFLREITDRIYCVNNSTIKEYPFEDKRVA